jgi:hypothetical protein
MEPPERGDVARQSQPNHLWRVEVREGAGAVDTQLEWPHPFRSLAESESEQFRGLDRNFADEMQRQVRGVRGNPTDRQVSRADNAKQPVELRAMAFREIETNEHAPESLRCIRIDRADFREFGSVTRHDWQYTDDTQGDGGLNEPW